MRRRGFSSFLFRWLTFFVFFFSLKIAHDWDWTLYNLYIFGIFHSDFYTRLHSSVAARHVVLMLMARLIRTINYTTTNCDFMSLKLRSERFIWHMTVEQIGRSIIVPTRKLRVNQKQPNTRLSFKFHDAAVAGQWVGHFRELMGKSTQQNF